MATINSVYQAAPNGCSILLWEAMATGDTITAEEFNGSEPLAGAVQITGTFGSATVTLQGSIDGTNFVTLKDLAGSSISTGVAAVFEFTTAVRYLKPAISGGSGDDVDVYVILRG